MNDTVNQQERLLNLAWLAGILEGEGNFSLVYGSGKRIMPRIGIINTDYVLIDTCCGILSENEIGHYVQERVGGCAGNPKHANAKNITIAGLQRVKKCLSILLPLLRAKKHGIAKLILEYIETRLARPKNAPYTPKDVEYVNRIRTLNQKGSIKSSETIRWTPGKHSVEDIVQAT
jgi:hypothetical protein